MSGRRLSLLAGLALIVAQICCAPPVVASPSRCPLKYTGGCPMQRQNTCRATQPQHATAVKPKRVVAAVTPRPLTADVLAASFVYLLAAVPPALEHAPLDLVLRI
jgi:hypothetical protein